MDKETLEKLDDLLKGVNGLKDGERMKILSLVKEEKPFNNLMMRETTSEKESEEFKKTVKEASDVVEKFINEYVDEKKKEKDKE